MQGFPDKLALGIRYLNGFVAAPEPRIDPSCPEGTRIELYIRERSKSAGIKYRFEHLLGGERRR